MKRKPGVTMMLRLKNEEQWIGPCVESIQWADKLLFVFQNCIDRTEEICRDLSDPNKSSFFQYPYDSRPNGPGNRERNPYDKHNRAYYYNWCYDKTDTQYVVKWDGDMVAFESLEKILRAAEGKHDFATFHGTNIVIKEAWEGGVTGKWFVNTEKEHCNAEPRFFKAKKEHPWITGSHSAMFNYRRTNNKVIPTSQFLHFKHAKCYESMTMAWPENWREIEHFKRIWKRGEPDNPASLVPYTGPIPKWINK